jgi:hypothetical protein
MRCDSFNQSQRGAGFEPPWPHEREASTSGTQSGERLESMLAKQAGKAIRSLGQTIDRIGVSLEGKFTYTEHRT